MKRKKKTRQTAIEGAIERWVALVVVLALSCWDFCWPEEAGIVLQLDLLI